MREVLGEWSTLKKLLNRNFFIRPLINLTLLQIELGTTKISKIYNVQR